MHQSNARKLTARALAFLCVHRRSVGKVTKRALVLSACTGAMWEGLPREHRRFSACTGAIRKSLTREHSQSIKLDTSIVLRTQFGQMWLITPISWKCAVEAIVYSIFKKYVLQSKNVWHISRSYKDFPTQRMERNYSGLLPSTSNDSNEFCCWLK